MMGVVVRRARGARKLVLHVFRRNDMISVICQVAKCVREMERAFCMLELPINSDVAGVLMTAETTDPLLGHRHLHPNSLSSSKMCQYRIESSN